MDLNTLKDVLSLPSLYGEESIVTTYIMDYAIKYGIKYEIDKKGNIYLTKGKLNSSDEHYPCVVSHIDTVHSSHLSLIKENRRLIIEESEDGVLTAIHPDTELQTGIGGDDKCGVFVCLELFKKFDNLKGAFFVEEEIGMRGSKEADDTFFGDVGYAIQFDAPSSNWITEVCYGVKIFDDKFKQIIKPILGECGYTNFSNDPFTDVNQLSIKYDFNCLNLGCGYHRQHSNQEYVIIEEVSQSLITGEYLIKQLGCKKYIRKNDTDDEFVDIDEFNEKSLVSDIVDTVISMYISGYDREDIEYTINNLIE